jgi:hypothetical protein
MRFTINSIEFIKVLNWVKKFSDDATYFIRIDSKVKILTVAVLLPQIDNLKSFFAFKFVHIDNVAEDSVDEYCLAADTFLALLETDYTKADQVVIAVDGLNMTFSYLALDSTVFYSSTFRFTYVDFPPLPSQEKFESAIELNKGFFNFVKICKDYLTSENNYVYSNSDAYVCRYAVDLGFAGSVYRGHLEALSPGKYNVFVGKTYFCLLSSDDSLYCVPYSLSTDTYKLTQALFNAEYEQSTWEVVPNALGQKLGQSGFTVSRGNNLFLVKHGAVEFLFLDN